MCGAMPILLRKVNPGPNVLGPDIRPDRRFLPAKQQWTIRNSYWCILRSSAPTSIFFFCIAKCSKRLPSSSISHEIRSSYGPIFDTRAIVFFSIWPSQQWISKMKALFKAAFLLARIQLYQIVASPIGSETAPKLIADSPYFCSKLLLFESTYTNINFLSLLLTFLRLSIPVTWSWVSKCAKVWELDVRIPQTAAKTLQFILFSFSRWSIVLDTLCI